MRRAVLPLTLIASDLHRRSRQAASLASCVLRFIWAPGADRVDRSPPRPWARVSVAAAPLLLASLFGTRRGDLSRSLQNTICLDLHAFCSTRVSSARNVHHVLW